MLHRSTKFHENLASRFSLILLKTEKQTNNPDQKHDLLGGDNSSVKCHNHINICQMAVTHVPQSKKATRPGSYCSLLWTCALCN